MSATVYVGGVDRSSGLIEYERVDEYCSPGSRLTVTFDDSFSCDTWGTVVLYEDGVKTFTGTIVRTEERRSENRSFSIVAKDDMRRLREYFVADDYVTNGEGIQYWIGFIAGLAGCSVTFTAGYDVAELAGMTLGRMFAFEIIDEFLLYAGWDIWCDANGTMYAGFRMTDSTPQHTIAAGANLASFDRSQDSEPPRNAAIVYTVVGTAHIQYDYGWEIDSNDVRTMVVSSIYVDTLSKAIDLANRMLSVAGPTYDIVRMILDDIETDMEVGDKVTYDNGVGESGSADITSIISKQTGGGVVKEFHVTTGERCPKVGAGGAGSLVDGRDIIAATRTTGLWRCLDIWDGTPTWYSMNNGLEVAYPEYGIPAYGGYNISWFIRDPYQPNSRAYLLTKYAIYETMSLVPGYEYWTPVLPFNNIALGNSPIGIALGDPGTDWCILKLRSTVAMEGRYFMVAGRNVETGWNNQKYMIITNNRFRNIYGGPVVTGAFWCGLESYEYVDVCRLGQVGVYYNDQVSINSWHHYSHYSSPDNSGSLAAWHKNSWGCTVTGTRSCIAANAAPVGWDVRVYSGYNDWPDSRSDAEALVVSNNNGEGGMGTLHGAMPETAYNWPVPGGASWLLRSGIHIPYNQTYLTGTHVGRYASFSHPIPDIVYFANGSYSRFYGGDHRYFPRMVQRSGGGRIINNLPWYDDDCNYMQGSIGTFTPNRRIVTCINRGKPARVAVSEDETLTWTEKQTIPVRGGCYSGFPYGKNKVYCGRHPTHDVAGADDPAHEDTALIYVSWDAGDSTWVDVTGDLWDKTKALGLRTCSICGAPLGAEGVVTLAPRYC